MTPEAIIQKTVASLSKLSQNRIEEVVDFVEFLVQKQENEEMQKNIYSMIDESEAFNFLFEEEEIYQLE